ncbi:MAG: hypothetical protein KR126chlam6_01433 [Candidatus Anoxychlamydiales bacterium]|nr:hypothetical protein [Candidatus Anoxychlamydiales bacterium]
MKKYFIILSLSYLFVTSTDALVNNSIPYPSVTEIPKEYDYLSPDGAEIRELLEMKGGNLVHCTLPAGGVSQAVKHQTIEELWVILEGRGEIYRKLGNQIIIDHVSGGSSIAIPIGVDFQFRNTGTTELKLIIVSIPPWPSANEAIKVNNYWTIENKILYD